jgi:hypothetical protein
VYIYPRVSGFRVSVRVSCIHGFGFGDRFPPESVFGSGSGFDFGFRFWVHGDSTRSEPDPLPSLVPSPYRRWTADSLARRVSVRVKDVGFCSVAEDRRAGEPQVGFV